MVVFPNAKINLGLQVIARRADGYHDIATAFYPVGWCDALEMVPADGEGCQLHLSGIAIDGDPQNNLVAKAYRLLAADFALPPVEAYLHKNVPFGAGLGGGSSDAAHALRLLRDLCALPLTDEALAHYAARLGADCAFFIYDRPLLAEGIGDRLSPLALSLKGYHLLLVKPPVAVSTAEAYSAVTPAVPPVALRDLLQRPVTEWKGLVENDFEKNVFALHPQLAELKKRLYEAGAAYAAMSGSGSTVYGLFEQLPEDAEKIFAGCRIWSGACAY